MNTNIIPQAPGNLAEQISYQADSIISKVLYKNENLNITLFAVAKGQEFTPHTTTRQAIVEIIEGTGEFMLAKKWHKFKAGDYFFMPENLLHAIKATENFKFVLYLIS